MDIGDCFLSCFFFDFNHFVLPIFFEIVLFIV